MTDARSVESLATNDREQPTDRIGGTTHSDYIGGERNACDERQELKTEQDITAA